MVGKQWQYQSGERPVTSPRLALPGSFMQKQVRSNTPAGSSSLAADLIPAAAGSPRPDSKRLLMDSQTAKEFLARSRNIIADIDANLSVDRPQLLEARRRVTLEMASCLTHYQLEAEPLRPQRIPLAVALSPQWGLLFHFVSKLAPSNLVAACRRWMYREMGEKQERPAGNDGIAPIVPVLVIKSLSDVFRELSPRENYYFVKHYGPPEFSHLCSLRDPEALLSDPKEARKLWQVVKRLCAYDGDRDFLKKGVSPHVPATLGPIRLERVGDRAFMYGEYSGLRIAVGSFRHKYAFLEEVQGQIAARKLWGASFTIAGRLDPDFLNWAKVSGRDDLGPIPDIELCYRFILPSGAAYHFILKAARNFSARPANNPEHWSERDHQVVRGLTRYFSDAAHRRSFDLFTELDAAEFPEETRELAASPLSINSWLELTRFHHAWCEVLYDKVLNAVEDPRVTYRRDPWLNAEYADSGYFLERVQDRLIRMPDEQTFFPPEFLKLDESGRARFVQHYARKLFEICNAERVRCKAESASPQMHEARKALGYAGPAEGFPLPLDYMLMDMIIDMTRFDKYRADKAKAKGIEPSQVRVPVRLGRSYHHPEWFLRADELRSTLEALPSQRRIRVTLEDPLSEGRLVEYPGNQMDILPDRIQATNIVRLRAALDRCRNAIRADAGKAGWNRMVARVSKLDDAVALAEDAFALAREMRAERMQKAEHRYAGNADYRDKMRAARAESDQAVVEAQNRLRTARESLIYLYRAFMPGVHESTCVRIHAIVDAEEATFIYSIGGSSIPVFSCTELDFKRCHSEALGGTNMYGGGELRFTRHRHDFVRYQDWAAFDTTYRASSERQPWRPTRLDDASGHYEPGFSTLQFSRNIIVPLLEQQGFDTSALIVGDALAPHTRMRGMVYDFARMGGNAP